mmetsp:Transcript_39611/g.99124  ORF Transcript_39611/g.99124 Transcript_39611/m.99124 type:complete len:627 (-) Transcript_39611:1506-3386(-)
MARAGRLVCGLLLDVHASMGEEGLKQAKECLTYWLRGRLIQTGKKDAGLVLVGSDATHNEMAEEMLDGYDNICVSRPLSNADVTLYQEIDKSVLGGTGGDVLSGIIVACSLLTKAVGTGKMNKHIVFATDAKTAVIDVEQIPSVADFLNSSDIHLTLFGLGFSGDNETQDMGQTECLLRDLVEQVGGELRVVPKTGDLASMRRENPMIRSVAAACNVYKGKFEVAPKMEIRVVSFPGVKLAKVPPLKRLAPGTAGGEVREQRWYQLDDDKGQQVDEVQIRKAYMYGGEYVVVEDELKDKIKSVCPQSMKFHCYLPRKDIKPHYLCSEAVVVVADPAYPEPSGTAFSSMVSAMVDDDLVSLVRWVKKEKANPEMFVMYPVIDTKVPHYSLRAVRYAWKEDTRCPKAFPPLAADTVSDAAKEAASGLISALMLPSKGADLLAPEAYPANPTLQRFWDVVHHKALHPDDPTPAQGDHITECFRQDQSLWDKALPTLKRLREACPLEDVAAQKEKRQAGGSVIDPSKLESSTASASGAGSSKDGVKEEDKDDVKRDEGRKDVKGVDDAVVGSSNGGQGKAPPEIPPDVPPSIQEKPSPPPQKGAEGGEGGRKEPAADDGDNDDLFGEDDF